MGGIKDLKGLYYWLDNSKSDLLGEAKSSTKEKKTKSATPIKQNWNPRKDFQISKFVKRRKSK